MSGLAKGRVYGMLIYTLDRPFLWVVSASFAKGTIGDPGSGLRVKQLVQVTRPVWFCYQILICIAAP